MILCFWFFLIASLHKRTTSVFALPTIFILFLPLKFEPLWMNAFSSFKQRRSSVWLLFLWLNSATSALFSWDSLAYCFLSPFMFLSILASSARTTSTFILLTTSAIFAEKCVLRLWSSSMRWIRAEKLLNSWGKLASEFKSTKLKYSAISWTRAAASSILSHLMQTSPLCWASITRGALSLTEMKRALKELKLTWRCFCP